VHRYKEWGLQDDNPVILAHSNVLMPDLTDEHKVARVLYARDKLDTELRSYDDFLNSVHVDEKWFFLNEAELNMWITPGEATPKRRVKHKSHIIKVMFLAAIARPRYNEQGECTFDGKIGMWPIVERTQAQRTSNNRAAGTWETKPVNVDRDVYRQMMIEKVLPAIKTKWPDHGRCVIIQQDGAKSHIHENDPAFVWAATTGNWNIKLETQPARSPDNNLCDLTFFRSLQSDYWAMGFALNIDDMISKVGQAFTDYEPRKLEKGWVTLASVLDEVLKCDGDNDFKIPHMGKDKILREAGSLPLRLPASEEAMRMIEHFEEEEEEVEIWLLEEQLREWLEEEQQDEVEIELLEDQLKEWAEEDQQTEVEIELLEEQLRKWAEEDLN
jgi:hypothetical protein